jgi:hypothetical protein
MFLVGASGPVSDTLDGFAARCGGFVHRKSLHANSEGLGSCEHLHYDYTAAQPSINSTH